MGQHPSKGVAVSALAVLSAALPVAAGAATLTYPGGAPCNTTLQACVTAAAAGDTIEIAQNAAIAESVDIDKSLTIQPATGFLPQVQFLFAGVTTVSKDVTVRGMAGGNGVRGFVGPGGGSLVLRVENNTFTAGTFPGIQVDTNFIAGTYGTLTLFATGNTITVNGGQSGSVSAISASTAAPAMDANIVGNRITVNNLSQSGGIEAVVGAAGGGRALIERNEIRGVDFDFGIRFRHAGANVGDPTSPFVGIIVNNLVFGQNGNVGAPGGIVLLAGGHNALLRPTVVNNTVAGGRTGLFAGARTDLGADIQGLIANNILAFNTNYDLGIDSGLPLLTNDHNLVTSLGDYGFDPGPGTQVGDPRFVNAGSGNLRLQSGSPAVDAGRDSALDLGFTIDLDGAPRRVGPIDRGAYESTFRAAAAAVPATGPFALLFLALGVAWLAWRRLRG